jgi:hypothetical protein
VTYGNTTMPRPVICLSAPKRSARTSTMASSTTARSQRVGTPEFAGLSGDSSAYSTIDGVKGGASAFTFLPPPCPAGEHGTVCFKERITRVAP